MNRLHFGDIWGAGDLKQQMIQIGNNRFSEHEDLAEWRNSSLLVKD